MTTVFPLTGRRLRIFAVIWLTLIVHGLLPAAHAQALTDDPVAVRRAALEKDLQTLEQTRHQLAERRAAVAELREGIANLAVTAAQVEEAETLVESAQIELESIKLDQANNERQQQEIKAALRQLDQAQQRAGAEPDPQMALLAIETEKQRQQALATLAESAAAYLRDKAQLAQERLQLESDRLQLLRNRHEAVQEAQRQEQLVDIERRIEQQRQARLAQAAELHRRLSELEAGPEQDADQRLLLETRIREADESLFLLQNELTIERARSTLSSYRKQMAARELHDEQLQNIAASTAALKRELATARGLNQRKLEVLAQLHTVLDKRHRSDGPQVYREAQALLEQLMHRFHSTGERLAAVEEEVLELDHDVQEDLLALERRGLWTRHSLPRSHSGWQQFASEWSRVPEGIGRALWQDWEKLRLAAGRASPSIWLRVGAGLLGWILFWIFLERRAPTRDPDAARGFAAKAWQTFLSLYCGLRYPLLLGGGLLAGVWALGVLPHQAALGTTLVLLLPLTPLLSRLLRPALGFWFSGELPWRTKICRLWRRLVYASAILLAVEVLWGYGVISESVGLLLERIYLLVLGSLAVEGWHLRAQVISEIERQHPDYRWLPAFRLVARLTLLSMAASALVGTLGFVNLAWATAEHLAWFFAVLLSTLALRGLVHDLGMWLKSVVVAHSSIGLFWAQGVIDPLVQVGRLGLLVAALSTLLHIYGIDERSRPIQFLHALLDYPLFQIGDSAIHLRGILILIGSLVGLFWLARWVKGFCYRWMYVGVTDIGLRNSLSVFTQYLVVLFGFLVILKSQGLNLTSLAIFTGAIGVGIGLGMQTIANNFISGLILLVERPIRVRDWVSIADAEGEVTNMGFRSVTVTTWDHKEVMIPNADLVSQPFVNWTRSDQVLRIMVQIGISYDDDPRHAQQVIEAAMRAHPGVLKDPPPRAYMIGYGPSSLDFQVQCYIDLQKSKFLDSRSELLMSIWEALRKAGITVPYPQRDLHLRPAAPLLGGWAALEGTGYRSAGATKGPGAALTPAHPGETSNDDGW